MKADSSLGLEESMQDMHFLDEVVKPQLVNFYTFFPTLYAKADRQLLRKKACLTGQWYPAQVELHAHTTHMSM